MLETRLDCLVLEKVEQLLNAMLDTGHNQRALQGQPQAHEVDRVRPEGRIRVFVQLFVEVLVM